MKHWKIKDYLVLPQTGANYVLRNLHFFGFLASLILVYISIVHQGQGRVREYQSLQKDVKEMRSKYLKMRSETIVNHQQSEISRQMGTLDGSMKGSVPKLIEKP
ncbi:MAG: hypothetical protein K9I85_00040 [Saprospiraceae bacterium]|nr:hypothetical protein [Saprospiraceae bacterium]